MKWLLRITCLLLTVAWLGFVFGNSADTGEQSSEKSGFVHEIVNDIAQAIGFEEEIPEGAIRTFAHFVSFAVLSVLLCTDIALFLSLSPIANLSKRYALLLASLPLSVLFALIDEAIQTFSPGRAPELLDIGVDSLGATFGLIGFAACFFLLRLILRSRKKEVAVPTT